MLKTLDFFLLFDGDGPPELESRSGEGLEIKIPLDNSSCNFSRTHILQNSICDILYTFCLRGEGGGSQPYKPNQRNTLDPLLQLIAGAGWNIASPGI